MPGAGRMAKPAENFKNLQESLSGFRSGNPRVKIFDDVSQGSKAGAHSLWFSVGAWRTFFARSQIVE